MAVQITKRSRKVNTSCHTEPGQAQLRNPENKTLATIWKGNFGFVVLTFQMTFHQLFGLLLDVDVMVRKS